MKIRKRSILLPLFCISMLCGCNSITTKESEIKDYVEREYVVSGTYDEIKVEKVTNKGTTIYLVYIFSHFTTNNGDTAYTIDIYVFGKDRLEWVYSI